MSRPALPFDLPLERLTIRPWHDPVVEAVGHDLRSPYVERFWLALLGPSTTLLLRHLAAELDASPEGVDLDLEDTARALGLGLRGGASSPFLRAIARTGQFHLARPDGAGAIAVRTRIQTLTHHQTERLPTPLRDEIWFRSCPLVRTRRRRKLADSSLTTTARNAVSSNTRQRRVGSSTTMPPAASAIDSSPSVIRARPSSSASTSTAPPARSALAACGVQTCGEDANVMNTDPSADVRDDT